LSRNITFSVKRGKKILSNDVMLVALIKRIPIQLLSESFTASSLTYISFNYTFIFDLTMEPHLTLLSVHRQTNQLMLYSEIIAVCSQMHTKHINTLCGQNVEFFN
jgi:hypothetical protein